MMRSEGLFRECYFIFHKVVEWTDCVQSDIWAFGIAGIGSGRRFMAAWRKDEVNGARHRQEKREATRLGKLLSHTESS